MTEIFAVVSLQCWTFPKSSLTCLIQQKVNVSFIIAKISHHLHTTLSVRFRLKESLPSLSLTEIISGDLLEDLMSSEGEFVD